ncbi:MULTISPECIES: hypothetical protein [Nocardia]|uniref:hypothetical protein n=1 Tax=Nocardia TaxID=1817 RepID=UPI0007E94B20|nr:MULTISPECIES: hypothetical protein [Nocardia]MBF6272959.1 hypothetical protein [Nocardia nova]OBA44148.1 hypothetical protein A5789_09770 [Nocardia sp. 852002-51101_SCH5132738]OBB49493.1 hypothetical protein A5748_19555 [Nocardia sp. 852002-51244_SCH5132740]OBF64939.1 hypothetical protein A9X06_08545 [Mycobacterium sp. 852002-51759_SCH5129042]
MTTRALVSDDVLPDWHQLWAAVRGDRGPGTHPVTALASDLARTPRNALGRDSSLVARRRLELIWAIDAWAAQHLRDTDQRVSIGAYTDKFAAAAVAADDAVRREGATGDARHEVFTEAARWAAGWTEIVDRAAPRTYRAGAG